MTDENPMSGPEAIDEDEVESCAFMSLIHHHHDATGAAHDDIEFDDPVSKIEVDGSPPQIVDGEEVGPLVELRLHGATTGRCVQVLLAAGCAIDLANKIGEEANRAFGD